MSSFMHVESTKKYISIFSEGSTQGLDDTTLTAEKSIQIILLSLEKKIFKACITVGQMAIYSLMA